MVTVSSTRAPSRSTVKVTSEPTACACTAAPTSDSCVTSLPSTATTRSPTCSFPYAGTPWQAWITVRRAGDACTSYPRRVRATYFASFCDCNIRSVLNCWLSVSLRHPTTSLRFSTSLSGSSHTLTTRHTVGSVFDTRTVRNSTAWRCG